jgi:hypothetical protein
MKELSPLLLSLLLLRNALYDVLESGNYLLLLLLLLA